ncbi:uncharacterized protein LOC113471911 [Diaphorina citri]|uniref:Uncharacterized protein LOC113471911 n=1 Tax=Diaphorina citri TaxID=121845 RepID=A0A3Q0JFB7_DIACI|nr:uncharacterized protein LOC113471911 [Diaphorina citri]
MEFSWKFPDDDVIITDDGYKFSNASKLRPTTKYLLFKCSHYGCRAKITMSLDKSKPLTIDFQHSHGSSEPSISKKKSSVSLQQKSIEKSKPSPIQKITNSTKISSPANNSNQRSFTTNSANKEKITKKPNLANLLTKNVNSNSTQKQEFNQKKPLPCTPVLSNTSATPHDKEKQIHDNLGPNLPYLSQTPTTSQVSIPVSDDLQGVATSSTKQKLYIITDSMGRGLASLLLDLLPQLEITQFTYPNASFRQCLDRAESICAGLTKEDFLFILSGTNNTTDLSFNSCPLLSFKSIANLRYKTNVIISSIPYRHDGFSYQNTNIYYANEYLKNKCLAMNINYLHINGLFNRREYTKHGLHLNLSGKKTLGLKLRDYIESHLLLAVNPSLSQLMDRTSSSRFVPSTEQNLMDVTCPFQQSILDETFSMTTPNPSILDETFSMTTPNPQTKPNHSTIINSEQDTSNDSILYHSADILLDNTCTSPSGVESAQQFFR